MVCEGCHQVINPPKEQNAFLRTYQSYIILYIPSKSNSGNPKKIYYHLKHFTLTSKENDSKYSKRMKRTPDMGGVF